jgi:hypothetical protein
VKIGFSKFCELRPKHCILAGASGTHSVFVHTIYQMRMAVFWVVAACSLVEVYHCFKVLAASIIALMMKAARTSEMFVNFICICRAHIESP